MRVLAILIILLFLGNIRSYFIVALRSYFYYCYLSFMFLVPYLKPYALGGLFLWDLVDNAIVVSENISSA